MDSFKLFILVISIFLTVDLTAQNRYFVFFSDKNNTPYSTLEPLEFLSQRSLDRRAKHSFLVTEEDLPVDPNYVSRISAEGADVFFTSRWLNGALVQMDESLVNTISALNFVDDVLEIAKEAKLSHEQIPYTIGNYLDPTKIQNTTMVQNNILEVQNAHSDGYTGNGILIAILDGGYAGVNNSSAFRSLHENGQILGVKDFVGNSGNPYQADLFNGVSYEGQDHGTSVLSVIGGSYGKDFIGSAPDADFILLLTEQVETENPVEEYNLLLGIEYADSAGADIINSSLSYGILWDNENDYPASSFDGKTNVASRAANFAVERGILVVNSAGNDGSSNPAILSPADSPHVLSVGAVTEKGQKAIFSSEGPTFDGRIKPDVVAMGVNVSVIDGSGEIVLKSGTSFSSPIMAGFAACLLQAYPTWTNDQVIEKLKQAGNRTASPDNLLGYGIPTYFRVENGPPLLVETQGFKVYPNPFLNEINISSSEFCNELIYHLYDLKGTLIQLGTFRPKSAHNSISLNSELERGIYFLELKSDSFCERIKLLKS